MKFVNTNKRFFFALVLALGFLASQSGITGLPPTTLQGWFESAKRTTFNFFVPNKQATKVSGGTLIETGNSNLLENASFENTDVDHAWTVADASISLETSIVHDGKQALKLTYIGDPVNLCQHSTINAAGFADSSADAINYARIKNSLDVSLYMCPARAGVTAPISSCIEVKPGGGYKFAKTSYPLGGTSNGICITSNGAFATGDMWVDDTKVGAQDVKQDAISVESQASSVENSTAFNNAVVTGATTDSDGSTLYSYNSATGEYTFLKDSHIVASISMATGSAAIVSPRVNIDGVNKANDSSPATGSQWASATYAGKILAGQVLTFSNAAAVSSSFQRAHVLATKAINSSIYSTAADSFSTDTHTLTHKTTAIASTDPVGTYNTYSYAINSNTKTICGTAPTTAPTKADGFLIYTRAYNAASTCGNPARVEIKIAEAGTSLPTLSKEIFKSTGKSVSGSIDSYGAFGTAVQYGFAFDSYDSATGIITLDAGHALASAVTTARFSFSDGTLATSGYLVINAQKMKDSVVGSFKEVVTAPGVTKPVSFGVSIGGASETTVCSSSPCTLYNEDGGGIISSVSWSALGSYTINLSGLSTLKRCTFGIRNWSVGAGVICYMPSRSSSSISVTCSRTDAAGGANVAMDIDCHGSIP